MLESMRVVLLSAWLILRSQSQLAQPVPTRPDVAETSFGLAPGEASPPIDWAKGHVHSIVKYPMDTRKENILRVSHHSCNECLTLDDFYAGNRWNFLLFFDRALQSSSKYKKTIIEGFMEICGVLKYSRIACGMVDMVEDQEYALKYIDPKTAPAHIIVVDGNPIPLGKHHVDALMKKPGDVPTGLWHIQDSLIPRQEGALDISVEVNSAEALTEMLKRHSGVIVIGAATADEKRRETIRAAAQGVMLEAEAAGHLQAPEAGVGPASTKDSAIRRWARERQRSRLVFAVVTRHAALKAQSVDDNSVVLFMNGQRIEGLPRILPGNPKDTTTQWKVESFTEVLRSALPTEEGQKKRGASADVAPNQRKGGKGGKGASAQHTDAPPASGRDQKSSASGKPAAGKGGSKSNKKAEL